MLVDFEKAFNRVSRDVIWRSLVARGIPDKIVAIIKESYNSEMGFVLDNEQLSDAFEVRHGDVLSPIFFLLAIDNVMTATVGEHERLGNQWQIEMETSAKCATLFNKRLAGLRINSSYCETSGSRRGQFNNLGSYLALDGETGLDVTSRIIKARSAFLSVELQENSAPYQVKVV
ncbi:uncharacterized protein LOC129946265 [Eupeodes corollae]|uniref:uncharacterized protein LOC129946265 n=1 Tax=Eupeodes corollae TaxID=290404 RepID=UPI00248FCC8D|nr:uncharacterized protein LOC129946265 [Eupeodes corollae]